MGPPSKKRRTSNTATSSATLHSFFTTKVTTQASTSSSVAVTSSFTRTSVSGIGTADSPVVIDDSDGEDCEPVSKTRVKVESIDKERLATPRPVLSSVSQTKETLPIPKASTSSSFFSQTADLNSQEIEFDPIDGDWELGDDENIPFEDDDEDMENMGPPPELVEGSVSTDSNEALVDDDVSNADGTWCPVCKISIVGWFEADIQEHVNSCLDGTPQRRKRPKPLAPLTSFRHDQPSSKSSSGPNAFAVLMSSHKENEAWKDAESDLAKKGKSGQPARPTGERRKAPFYKVMQGMPIAVDAFRYGKIPGVKAYLLTHAHSDHYTNLSSSWKNGPIYCSETTANLIKHVLKVDPTYVHGLPLDTPTVLPNTGGVTVTLIEANHCPGSVLFLFEGPQTIHAGDSMFKSPFVGTTKQFRYLHCGDYRACPQHVLHPAVKVKRLDLIYLDTTYLDPKYCFPPQRQVIDACAELVKQVAATYGDQKAGAESQSGPSSMIDSWLSVPSNGQKADKATEKPREKLLIVVGTYSIGKERIVKAIAQSISSKVYCDSRKTLILKCQDDPELHDLLTADPLDATVHLMPLHDVTSDGISDYIARFKQHFTRAIAFRPTGWTYTPPTGTDLNPTIMSLIAKTQARMFSSSSMQPTRNSSAKVLIYGVPYSEHSSFFELTCFALSLDWSRMIATVNVGSQNSRGKMQKWFERWEVQRKKRKEAGMSEDVVPYRSVEYW